VVRRLAGWGVAFAAIVGIVAYIQFRPQPIEVTVGTVERGPVEQTIASVSAGTVKPTRQLRLMASTFGAVSRLHAGPGDEVTENAVIVELDHRELDAHVAMAEAALAGAKSALEQAQAAEALYEKDGVTVKPGALGPGSPPSVSIPELGIDPTQLQQLLQQLGGGGLPPGFLQLMDTLPNKSHGGGMPGLGGFTLPMRSPMLDVDGAKRQVKQLEAALAAAKSARDKAFIRAPFAGTLVDLYVQLGETVGMGMPVGQLVQMGDLYVEAPFDEAHAPSLALGQRARIEVDAYPDRNFSGEVLYVSPVVSVGASLSRTLTLRIDLLDGHERLLPGMSTDVTIVSEEKESALLVPTEALVRLEAVYVVENGRAVRRPVELGIGNWSSREIVSGLQAGEEIVTSVAVAGLEDDVAIRRVEELDER